MDTISGEISLAKKVDYERQQNLDVMYVATDGGGLESKVRLSYLVNYLGLVT